MARGLSVPGRCVSAGQRNLSMVEANRFPLEELSLVEITDVEPYLRGQDEFLRAIRRRKSP